MSHLILKEGILDKMRKDPVLFGKVGECLGLSVRRLMDIMYKDDARLTQASVLKIIKEHLKVTSESELLTEATPVKATA